MLSLAAATVLDAGPLEVVEAAAAAGFDACGLRLDPAVISTRTVHMVVRALSTTGLRLLDVEVVRMRTGQPVSAYRPILDLAATLGAPWVLAVSEIADAGERVDQLAELTDLATAAGVAVSLEFMAFTAVRTLADAIEAATAVPTCRVLVDALHLARTAGTAADVVPHAGVVSYIQICDARTEAPRGGLEALIAEARHDRLLPGSGQLDLVGLIAAVPAGTAISVEVQSDRLAAELDVQRRAQAAYRAARLVLDMVQDRPAGSARGT